MKTIEEARRSMLGIGLESGERRTFVKCRGCGSVFVREFIPGGLGRGRTFGACLCFLTQFPDYTDLESVDGPVSWEEVETKGRV